MNETVARLTNLCNWKKWVFRRSPPLWRSLENIAFLRETLIKNTGLDLFVSWKSELIEMYLSNDEYENVMKMLFEKSKENIEVFIHHANYCYSFCDEYMEFCKKDRPLNKFCNKELSIIFHEYIELNNKMVAYRPLIKMLNDVLQSFLEEALVKAGSPDFHYDWIMPIKNLPFVAQRNDLLSIAEEIRKQNININESLPQHIEDMIASHISKFGWLSTRHFFGNQMTRIEAIDLIKEISVGSSKLKQQETEKKKKVESLKRFKDNHKQLANLIDIAQDYAYLTTYRIDVGTEANLHFRQFFMEIAKRMDITYEQIIYLTANEIIDWLSGTQQMDALKRIIEKRKEYFITFVVNGNEIHTFEGEENRLPEHDDQLPEVKLKGVVAQVGKIQGAVKVVRSKTELDKLKDNDIIVTPMTMPEMLVGILKCSAIITDEGGITCHAAQISREFKIPCIMATGNASKILKDGDVVEVMAEGLNGEVKIIKRASIDKKLQ